MGSIQLSPGFKELISFAAEQLKGPARRLFMAKTVKELARRTTPGRKRIGLESR